LENYLIRIQYTGQYFYGFQKQQGLITVQGCIEDALSLVLRSSINTFGSSRTDRGVNALNQYINFYFENELDTQYLKMKLNGLLFEKGIAVKEITKVDKLFHARKSSKGKIYAYIISNSSEKAMFLFPYVYLYKEDIDRELLGKTLEGLKGKHDFSIFANRDRAQPERYNICEIFDLGVLDKKDYLVLYFYGDRFLYHMVRRMVYYILKASSGHIPEEVIINPFSQKKVPYTRQVLPPGPLFLVDVVYRGLKK